MAALTRIRANEYKGWTMSFRRNIHMYCRDLRAIKGKESLQVQCEDSPAGEGLVGVWSYLLKLDPTLYADLISALHEWASPEGLNYRLYVTRDQFETSPT
jgi:hypothetical protein